MATNLAGTLIKSAERITSCRARQPHVQGCFEDAAIRSEFEEARRVRERVNSAMSVGRRGSPARCTLRLACRRLREVIQVGLDTYLDVYAKDLENYSIIGYVRD